VAAVRNGRGNRPSAKVSTNGHPKMILIRVGLAVYLLLLSFLLLAPEPLKLLGFTSPPGASSLRMVHFCLFAVLGFLVWASRLPVRPGLVLGLLVAYALVTETLQWFVPTRTVELLDYLENLVGLASGGAVGHLLQGRGPVGADRRAAKAEGNDMEAPPAEEDPQPGE
jgi:VanZ family protein